MNGDGEPVTIRFGFRLWGPGGSECETHDFSSPGEKRRAEKRHLDQRYSDTTRKRGRKVSRLGKVG